MEQIKKQASDKFMTTKEVKLEKVASEDCREIRDLMVKVYEDEKARWFHDGEKPFIPGYASIAMQEYHTWDNTYYKILYEENMAGVILISYTGKEHARIDRFYLLPEYQGSGIGSQVLQLIEAAYPKVTDWTLDTIQQSPRNHHFYEKNGYVLEDEDEEERYYHKTIKKDKMSSDEYCCNENLSKKNIRQCNMSELDVYDSNMSDSKFSNMNLSNNVYINSNLWGTRITNTNLEHSILADSKLNHAELCFLQMSDAHVHDLNLDLENEDSSLRAERCKLCNSIISDSSFENVKIANSDLVKANIETSDLSNANIENSNLTNVNIVKCDMEGMTIDGIKVTELLQLYHSFVSGKNIG